MNKIIRITANENEINIFVNEKMTASIKNEEKSEVNGEMVFNSLDYSPKDKYLLEPFSVNETEAKKNYKAAEMIYDLYKKIVDGINAIEIKTLKSDEIEDAEGED